ncbi:FAD binding domain-containing protein [Porcincola intestinalis]|uniref:FAD binding domain-containing protein n=1 Tax=Porcincola intestinalis TaxID=2606632 RepID=UPI0023F172A3|nr:FAD binding domain-containing protein [Porcincola intestinalis]MDD7059838.1 FAD binding domain-containing protein [Porcincola intestinalis]MDY5283082.1 FAD binding domain-containing protein [Porcincola intestinalis]
MSRELCAAASASEAVIMRDASSAYLAGGTELLRSGTERSADRLIMLKNIPELKGVSGETPEAVRIGSMTTFQEALGSDLVPAYLKEALRYMASRTKRDMATIGGNVALMRDDSYLAATLIAAHAKLELLHWAKPDSGESVQDRSGCPDKNGSDLEEASQVRGDQPVREPICIRRYLQHREEYQKDLITAIMVRTDICVVSKRYANTAESHSYLTAAMGYADGRFRVGVSVKNAGVFFPKEFSDSLGEDENAETFARFANSWAGLDIPDDLYGSTAYKRYLLGVTLENLYRSLKERISSGQRTDGRKGETEA